MVKHVQIGGLRGVYNLSKMWISPFTQYRLGFLICLNVLILLYKVTFYTNIKCYKKKKHASVLNKIAYLLSLYLYSVLVLILLRIVFIIILVLLLNTYWSCIEPVNYGYEDVHINKQIHKKGTMHLNQSVTTYSLQRSTLESKRLLETKDFGKKIKSQVRPYGCKCTQIQ